MRRWCVQHDTHASVDNGDVVFPPAALFVRGAVDPLTGERDCDGQDKLRRLHGDLAIPGEKVPDCDHPTPTRSVTHTHSGTEC